MKIQKATYFALIAVLELAGDPQRQVSTAEIAKRYDISSHHLAKVMRMLVRAGLAQSVRGVGGGYTFRGNANRITIMDIVEIFEPREAPAFEYGDDSDPATKYAAALLAIGDEIDDLTQATFRSITLNTLLDNAENLAAKHLARVREALDA